MKNLIYILPFAILLWSSCNKTEDFQPYIDFTPPEQADYFFTGKIDETLIHMSTVSEDTLILTNVGGMNVGNGNCAKDYISKIHNDVVFHKPSVEVSFMHFFNGSCEGQEQIDEFEEAFPLGTYPFDLHRFGEPGIRNSVAVKIQLDNSLGFYSSDSVDNTNSYFEITSSESLDGQFYKKRIIEGKLSCNLKTPFSDIIVKLEDATFKMLVALERQ